MEKIIKITGFSNKKQQKDTTKTFPCFEIIRDGKAESIGVFEDDVVAELKKQIDQWVKVVMVQRPNSQYWNITHYVGLAKQEEIPSGAKLDTELYNRQEPRVALQEAPQPVLLDNVTKVIHEVITDSRRNSMECGKAGERVKIYFDKVEDFARQYEEVVLAKRVVDAKLNQDEK